MQGHHAQFLAGKVATLVAISAAYHRTTTFYSEKSRQVLLGGLASGGGPAVVFVMSVCLFSLDQIQTHQHNGGK